jgi:hypothetical protein
VAELESELLARGGLIFNRAPALPRHSACVFRVPRPKPRLPEKVGTPLRTAARVVRGGAPPPPPPGAPKVKDWTRLRAARSWRSSARRRSSWTAASAVQEWTKGYCWKTKTTSGFFGTQKPSPPVLLGLGTGTRPV